MIKKLNYDNLLLKMINDGNILTKILLKFVDSD